MTSEDLAFLKHLAATTKKMFIENDRLDVHYSELADRYFGGLAISGEAYGAVRQRLARIRDILELDDIFLVLMSRDYFGIRADHERMNVRVVRPKDRRQIDELLKMDTEKIRPLLAGGNTKSAHGLYRPVDKNDPIEAAHYEYAARSAGGKLIATGRRLDNAQEAGRLSDDEYRRVMTTAIPGEILARVTGSNGSSPDDRRLLSEDE